MHKKGLKFVPAVELTKLYHSNRIAKSEPRHEVWPEHPLVQIDSSSPWF